MAHLRSFLSVPTGILADCRFAAAPKFGGTPRPSGAGLTGGDIMLLFMALDAADKADANNNVFIPQATITKLTGTINHKRIDAALERLEGTDLMHGVNVYHTVRSCTRLGTGRRPRVWVIELDKRLVELARAAKAAGRLTKLDAAEMRHLSSRWSMVLWCRWMAVLDGAYPPREIGFGKAPDVAAMDFEVPQDAVPAFFGHYGRMARSVADRFVLTASDKSPIRKELRLAGVGCDITPVMRAGFDDRIGIKIQMGATVHDGLRYLTARQRNEDRRRAARIARMNQYRPPETPSA